VRSRQLDGAPDLDVPGPRARVREDLEFRLRTRRPEAQAEPMLPPVTDPTGGDA
jgi:hypothetical protein